MYCKHCGFQLQEDVNYCPVCGKRQSDPVVREPAAAPTPEPPQASPSAAAPVNIYCVIGFSLSCASFLLTFFGLTALAGLILSVIGLRQLPVKGERGKGFAVAGIIIAVVSLILLVLALITIQRLIASGEFARSFSVRKRLIRRTVRAWIPLLL